MTRSRLRGRAGLTLIELVVALAVGGAALAAGALALGGLVDRRDALDVQTRHLNEALVVRRSLESWLSAAQLDPHGSVAEFQGIDRQSGDRADDALTFRSISRELMSGRPAEVTVRVIRDSSSRLLVTARVWGSSDQETIMLIADADALDIEYLLRESESSVWIPSWTSGTVLPAAVRVRISSSSPESHQLLLLPLHVRLSP